MSEKRPAALGFIFITLLIDVTGLGIIIPVLPSLIKELINGDLSQAAQYGGWLLFAYAGMQFLFAPVLGGLSDRFGRRPVLLASLFGFGLDYLLLAFAPNIWWLFVGRLLAGVTGASFTTASAYIADISTPEKRAQNFGIIGAAFGLGFIIGPVIGGLLGQYGSRVPFFAAAALALLNWLYGYFVLPESLPADKRRAFSIRRANPLGSLKALQKYPKVLGLVGAFFFIYLGGHVNQSTWAYFTMLKFGWNEAWVGYSLGFVGLTVAIVQGGLIRIVVPKIGQWNAVFVGMFFYILGFILFAFATQGWMMFAFMVPFALGGFAGPSLQSLISGQVPSNEQGELQGALTSMTSVTSIIGPPLMTNLFAYFTGENPIVYFPGAAFLAAALITVVAVFLAIPSFNKRNS
ncbi:TCR/Tet family MFS transporter [Imperialibacter roseus]|uniref:TCR/Tet family MFS transporter n=1 Tax=Imperialibacter roseus TaxID=1324217 RepID=A0ABZ0IMH8_9BACT|nr:TCR/Tet family MFS transporter [Imperialibacter roseus]WOK05712.1 TCR/Tet family MFS transporter [Imperialibacter roseus]